MQCQNGNKRDGIRCSANGLVTTIFWICWQHFLSSLAPFKAKLWHKGKLRRGKPVKSVKWFKQQFRRFFFDFTNVSLITLGKTRYFGQKTLILLKPPNLIFLCEFWFLLKMGVSKGENIQILVIKRQNFIHCKTVNLRARFWRITQQQLSNEAFYDAIVGR